MGISANILREILEAGIMAPSGDNCQPWRFEVQGDVVRLFNIPDRDVSQYNFRQRASHIAHGALIENMSIAASVYCMKAEVALLPDTTDADLVAEIRLVPGDVVADSLVRSIAARCTNRQRYRGGVLEESQREHLISVATPFPGVQVRFFSGKEMERAARVIGLNDRLVFENRDLHTFLFDHIRWSDAEAEATRDGMDIKTLELAPFDAIAFRLFKSFDLVRFLNRFGVSRIIGANARKLAMSAAAIGVITMPSTEPVDYIACGRAMERVWLEATRQGLAFQLMTGITCLMGRVANDNFGTLKLEHVKLVNEARSCLDELIGTGEYPLILFRVGKAECPTARSLRHPLL